ncbi:MAG TPA: nicotinate-nucleotide--dimethylbenzimidazole phosphoribosyltransferase [Candidatus Eubacterium avistercoris]|uniref:Nicotinate-nucleotide--dimethylbenzimidazole phosphoribosyltransferase n=1 Tax=Candidatus Eubacterium avistercoris TaxID=2838567 RepID=A0A9D2D4V7_9FIRM|nr:nicotinate-nucleotide--dimethylbenzimidazole phosphoribosyltransferase [Candidatus Eubacterium avistercoris]
MTIEEAAGSIRPLDTKAMEEAWKHWDGIAKPLRSFGKLEKAVVQIAGITGTPDVRLPKKGLVIMCADNGVVEEGVTQSGQEVTAVVAENFLDTKSCVSIMCRHTGTGIFPVDIGMAVDTPRVEKRKVAYGTKNLARERAMTRQEAVAAVEVGIEKVLELKEQGYQILATGEMGIGNTTTSSAVTSVLLDVDPRIVTGRGAGLSSEGLERKIQAIRRGIRVNRPDPSDPIDVLSKVGGLDIAGLTGVFLGGAALGIPVVMDGFISGVAALLAVRIAPACKDYILASHKSNEPASQMILDALDKEAFLTCDMCLGEGSGAVALFPILDLALCVYHEMSTFDEAKIETYVPLK